MEHSGDCLKDDIARSMCEDRDSERIDAILGLSSALREVYALTGEDPDIERIVNEALSKYDIPGVS